MKKTAAIVLAAFIFFMANPSLANHYSFVACGVNLGKIIDQFVDEEFPPITGKLFDPTLLAANDVRCESDENMLNIAIIVSEVEAFKGTQNIYFGIFHLHFSKEKNFLSAAILAAILSDNDLLSWEEITDWKKFNSKDELNKHLLNKWCEFISLVYPAELKAQGC